MLTFDDGMYNNKEYIYPLLKKYNAYAIFSIVGSYTDEYTKSNIVKPAYSYLRWCDVAELANSGYVEFGNHSYNLHSISSARYGTKRKRTETALEYIAMFHHDTQKMQSAFSANCKLRPIIYTYPFGGCSEDSLRVLEKSGFLISLSCIEGINKITRDNQCLSLMKRFNRDGLMSTKDFFIRAGIT